MTEHNDHNKEHNKHLLSAESLARTADADQDTSLTRGPGQGNGKRVHGIYLAAISLVAVLVVIGLIAAAVTMM